MNNKSKSKHNILAGVIGGTIVLLVGFVILAFNNPYANKPFFIKYEKELIYEGNHLNIATSYNAHTIIEELRKQKVLLTPNEFTSNLGTYYNTLISILLCLFTFFSLISYFTVKNTAKNEVKEALLEIEKKSNELDHIIKQEVHTILDEMLRDSKMMQDKLDQSITGLINDALGETIDAIPALEKYNDLIKDIVSLKSEQETQLELINELVNDNNIKDQKVIT